MADRQHALAVLEEGRTELEALFGQLDDAQLAQPRTIGGGDWAAKDLMGHVAFWEELAIEAIEAHRAGRAPRVDSWRNADAANAENQARTAGQSVEEIKCRAAEAHRALTSAIQELSDQEWGKSGERVGGILGGPKRAFDHAFAHLDELRAYVDSIGRR